MPAADYSELFALQAVSTLTKTKAISNFALKFNTGGITDRTAATDAST